MCGHVGQCALQPDSPDNVHRYMAQLSGGRQASSNEPFGTAADPTCPCLSPYVVRPVLSASPCMAGLNLSLSAIARSVRHAGGGRAMYTLLQSVSFEADAHDNRHSIHTRQTQQLRSPTQPSAHVDTSTTLILLATLPFNLISPRRCLLTDGSVRVCCNCPHSKCG